MYRGGTTRYGEVLLGVEVVYAYISTYMHIYTYVRMYTHMHACVIILCTYVFTYMSTPAHVHAVHFQVRTCLQLTAWRSWNM